MSQLKPTNHQNSLGFHLRVAFVGCGAIAQLHLAGILAQPTARLIAVVDPDLEKATALADEAEQLSGQPKPATFPSLHALLVVMTPDVIHIMTPHFTHVDLAIQAIRAGCHVLIEKPVAIDQQSLMKLHAAADLAVHQQVGVCLQNRYNKASQAAHQLLADSPFGAIISARAFVTWWRDADYYTQSPWRGRWQTEGGSLMINQALHTLDLMQWLVGPVKTVSGHIFNDHLPDVIETEDTATALLQFKNGATGVFFATNAYPASADPFIEIVCEKAIIRLEGSDRIQVLDRSGNPLPEFNDLIVAEEAPEAVFAATLLPPEKAYWGKSHAILIGDFYHRLKTKQPFALNTREGSQSLETLFAWYESSRTSNMVKLS
ncbi:MAG: Gfo/Idh/MocA family oxidoreductase [Eubacteriales bacterium]|nr:Gfo/Idh/MocA family oxidoreductase [Eubacteriales bacterium]